MSLVIDLHNSEVVLQWVAESFFVSEFVICRIQTSFWFTMDCASSVLNCVTVFACCLVLSIIS